MSVFKRCKSKRQKNFLPGRQNKQENSKTWVVNLEGVHVLEMLVKALKNSWFELPVKLTQYSQILAKIKITSQLQSTDSAVSYEIWGCQDDDYLTYGLLECEVL